ARYTGLWHVPSAAAGTHTITVNFTAGTTMTVLLMDYGGLATTSPFDTYATLKDSGTITTAVTTNSATPSQSGELAIAWWCSAGANTSSSTWTNGFTQELILSSAPSGAAADLVVAGTTSTSTGTTLTTGTYTIAGVAFFKPAGGGSSCTHEGRLSNGTIAVPTASSAVVWRKDGTFGTVDCAGTQYYQPKNGATFGVN